MNPNCTPAFRAKLSVRYTLHLTGTFRKPKLTLIFSNLLNSYRFSEPAFFSPLWKSLYFSFCMAYIAPTVNPIRSCTMYSISTPPSNPNLYDELTYLLSSSLSHTLSSASLKRFTPTFGIIDHSPASRFCAPAFVITPQTSMKANNLEVIFFIFIDIYNCYSLCKSAAKIHIIFHST